MGRVYGVPRLDEIRDRYRNGLLKLRRAACTTALREACEHLIKELDDMGYERATDLADPCTVAEIFLKEDEGLRLRPYVCPAGYLTIGYGHNLGLKATPDVWSLCAWPERDTLTLDEAKFILETDVEAARQDVLQVLGARAFYGLSVVRQAVLLCMAFQLGRSGFASFRRMISAIQKDDVASTVTEMLDSKWSRDFPRRSGRYASSYTENELP